MEKTFEVIEGLFYIDMVMLVLLVFYSMIFAFGVYMVSFYFKNREGDKFFSVSKNKILFQMKFTGTILIIFSSIFMIFSVVYIFNINEQHIVENNKDIYFDNKEELIENVSIIDEDGECEVLYGEENYKQSVSIDCSKIEGKGSSYVMSYKEINKKGMELAGYESFPDKIFDKMVVVD